MRSALRRMRLKHVGLALVAITVVAVVYTMRFGSKPPTAPSTPSKALPAVDLQIEEKVHIATAVCEPFQQGLLQGLIKSALFTSQHVVCFYIFAPPEIQISFAQQVLSWPYAFARKLEVRMYNPHVPEGWSRDPNRQLLCDVQPFVLTTSLPQLDRVLWMHVDALFMAPVEAVWDFFLALEPVPHFAVACTLDMTVPGNESLVPWKGPRTEVMLLQLKEMRKTGWTTPLLADLKTLSPRSPEFRNALSRHFLSPTYKKSVYWLPCTVNFGAELCPSTILCEEAKTNGILVMRGAASSKDPVLSEILQAFANFRLGVHCNKKLPYLILSALSGWSNSTCGFRPDMYVQQINAFLERLSRVLPDSNCVH